MFKLNSLQTFVSYSSFLAISMVIMGCSVIEDPVVTDRPNIVLILSDDQGWMDYGFMGHPHIKTPNIDALVETGLTFTRGYVAAPLCSPSLASIISGVYPHNHGITGNDPTFTSEFPKYSTEWRIERSTIYENYLDHYYSQTNLIDLLSNAGYSSLQTGKWWLGSWQRAGFSYGMSHGDPTRQGRHGDEGLKIGRQGMQPIRDFLENIQQTDSSFFIWYAPFLPHTPHTPPDSLLKYYLTKTTSVPVARYWAMCEWFDQTIGELRSILRERGALDNTVIIYICDNGWQQNPDIANKFMPKSKRAPYDLGIRSPIIYHCPKRVKEKIDAQTLVSALDIFPTILQLAGISDTGLALDGIDILDSIKLNNRKLIFSEDFSHDMPDPDGPLDGLQHKIVLQSPWKLIVNQSTNQAELYNIIDDPYEEFDVIGDFPEVGKELSNQLASLWSQ